jgi:hypothetical protein
VEYPNAKWGRLGESEEYFWETETEKKKINKHTFHLIVPKEEDDYEAFDR